MIVLDRRHFLRASALAAAGAFGAGRVLAGCASGAEDDGEYSAPLFISAYPFAVQSAPYIVARATGIFGDHGWTIEEFVGGPSGGAGVRAMLAGDHVWGASGAAGVLQAKLVGAPIRILTETVRSPAELVWVTTPDRTDLSADDLAGTRIGVTTRGSGAEATALLALDQLGLTGEAEIVVTGGLGEGMALLDRADIDMMVTIPALLNLETHRIVWAGADIVPRLTESFLYASESFVAENPNGVQAFMDAYAVGVERLEADVAAAASLWAEESELPEEGTLRTLQGVIDFQGFVKAGYDEEALAMLLRSMQLQGLIDDPDNIDLTEELDQSFIPSSERL